MDAFVLVGMVQRYRHASLAWQKAAGQGRSCGGETVLAALSGCVCAETNPASFKISLQRGAWEGLLSQCIPQC